MWLVCGVSIAGFLQGGDAFAESSATHGAASRQEVHIERVTPAYWRITLDIPPFNIFGPETIPQLNEAITQLERDPQVKVVVFDSAVPGFFLTHYDFVPPLSDTTNLPPGPTGLPPLPDMLVRLSRAPVVSIVSIRGAQPVSAASCPWRATCVSPAARRRSCRSGKSAPGLVPGGGPMARLPRLMGRGRALEVLLSGEDIPATWRSATATSTARCLTPSWTTSWTRWPGASPGSTSRPSPTSKRLVDIPSLPPDIEIGAEWDAFLGSAHRPQPQQNLKRLMEMGLQTNPDVEKRLPYYTGTLGK